MSRCFPYPPLGYEKNGICDEALIESIKLERKQEKAKKERKKQKKQERKEKEKARGHGEIDSQKQSEKKRHRDERSQKDQKAVYCQKSRGNEVDHLEKSSLTEEYGYPVGPENSYDSTLNTNKRQKLSLTPDARHNSGNIIRIRLPQQRLKDPEVQPSKELSFPALGRTDVTSVQRMHGPSLIPGREQENPPCSTSGNIGQQPTLKRSKEKQCLSLGASENFIHQAKLFVQVPPNPCSSFPPLALKFRDLVEDWIAPQIQVEDMDFANQDWLFEMKEGNHNTEAEGYAVGSSHENSSLWPHSRYLPCADIYALPFTVPF